MTMDWCSQIRISSVLAPRGGRGRAIRCHQKSPLRWLQLRTTPTWSLWMGISNFLHQGIKNRVTRSERLSFGVLLILKGIFHILSDYHRIKLRWTHPNQIQSCCTFVVWSKIRDVIPNLLKILLTPKKETTFIDRTFNLRAASAKPNDVQQTGGQYQHLGNVGPMSTLKRIFFSKRKIYTI